MTEGGGERVIECGKTGGYGRAEGGEGRDELLFGVVVLVEEGDGVKVVLLLLTTSFLLSVIIVPPFVVFFFFRCIVGSFSLCEQQEEQAPKRQRVDSDGSWVPGWLAPRWWAPGCSIQ